jgi:hypothetical protein
MAAINVKNCYAGQIVYWVMWADPNDRSDNRCGFYAYKRGLEPEIWESVVEKASPRKIWLKHYPKFKGRIYSCAQDAIDGEYATFCKYANGYPFDWRRESAEPIYTLGDASALLRKLAELEFNLNNAVAAADGVIERCSGVIED